MVLALGSVKETYICTPAMVCSQFTAHALSVGVRVGVRVMVRVRVIGLGLG